MSIITEMILKIRELELNFEEEVGDVLEGLYVDRFLGEYGDLIHYPHRPVGSQVQDKWYE